MGAAGHCGETRAAIEGPTPSPRVTTGSDAVSPKRSDRLFLGQKRPFLRIAGSRCRVSAACLLRNNYWIL